MSYILDALRKADAQRERSRLPGLQAQPRAAARESAGVAVPQSVLAGTAVVLGLGFAAAAAWQLTRDDAATATVANTASTASTAAAALPSEPAVAAASAEAVPPAAAERPPAQQILPPAPPPLPAPRPAPARLATSPASATTASPPEAAAPASAVTANQPQAAAPAPTQLPAAAAGVAVSSTVPAGAPALAISGGVWSQDPLQRMLVVGGRVFSEGSELAPGVRLQEIRQHRAVLDFRGQRYAVPY